jgi:hypothetical protein
MMNCINLIIVSLVSALIATNANATDRRIIIKISYKEVHERILPFVETTTTNVDNEVTLNTDRKISSHEDRSSGRAFGQSSKNLILGPGKNEEWRVASADKLINIADYISYRRAILLTVRGSSCTAEVDYELKPGFSDFRYHRLTTGEAAVARSVKAYDVRCSVQ